MFINRFPKMAALQKYRALALGYDEELAKALGIAEATKYAIFKNLSYRRRKEQEAKEVQKHYKRAPEELDVSTFALFKLQALDGMPFVGNKIYTAFDYEKAIYLRWGEEIGKKIEEWAQKIIQNCSEEVLKSERKFFEECWKPHRDEDPLSS